MKIKKEEIMEETEETPIRRNRGNLMGLMLWMIGIIIFIGGIYQTNLYWYTTSEGLQIGIYLLIGGIIMLMLLLFYRWKKKIMEEGY
jgi:hypothetical protein